MKIKVRYTRHELGKFAKNAFISLLTGFLRLLWSVILLLVNLALWLKSRIVGAICKKPCLSVAVTFLLMLLLTAAVHMDMKAKLTTTEWQRDNVQMRLDSLCETYNINPSYSRLEAR